MFRRGARLQVELVEDEALIRVRPVSESIITEGTPEEIESLADVLRSYARMARAEHRRRERQARR